MNVMKFKAMIKKIGQEKQISAQLVLQNYMLERLLERVSLSAFKDNFILKGGLLIASMVGLNSRATMDMDTTIRNYPVDKTSVSKMFEEILNIKLDDDIFFDFVSIGKIRELDEYDGFRVSLTANYSTIKTPLKIDVTTGDKITPNAILYKYPLVFENKFLEIFAYNLETILAEKLETIISRGDQNTRPRDFYDIYILYKLQKDKIDFEILNKAIQNTSAKRGSLKILQNYLFVVEQIKDSNEMLKHWNIYQKQYNYAKDIDFVEICNIVIEIMKKIF